MSLIASAARVTLLKTYLHSAACTLSAWIGKWEYRPALTQDTVLSLVLQYDVWWHTHIPSLSSPDTMLPIPEYVTKACEASEAAFYAFARSVDDGTAAEAEAQAERAAVRRDVAIQSFVAVAISKDRRQR